MSHEYRDQLDIKNNEKINELLNDMPEFVEYFYDHMVAKGRSTNTILGYMYEINVFLRFVQVIAKKDSVKHLEVSDLEKFHLNRHFFVIDVQLFYDKR